MMQRALAYDYMSREPIGNVVRMENYGRGLEVYVELDDAEKNMLKRIELGLLPNDQSKHSGNYLPPITKVIFNNPATIVFFADGDKIVVKCSDTDDFDPYVGICMAIAKKAYQNQSVNYMIKHLVDKYYSPVPDGLMKALMDSARNVLAILNND